MCVGIYEVLLELCAGIYAVICAGVVPESVPESVLELCWNFVPESMP
jgi:hypothetical protein